MLSHPRTRESSKLFALGIAAFALASFLPNVARALPSDILWYSGDPNLTQWGNSATNPDAGRHWQPFEVTDANGWTIESIFSVGQNYGRTTAEWSIRTGMSPGNGGTTIASGIDTATISPVLGSYSAIEVDITPLVLSTGVYWVEVAIAECTNGCGGTIVGSDGTNSIGTTPPQGSLRYWPAFNQNYQPYSDHVLSSGVTGSVVPEPSSAFLLGLGLVTLARCGRRYPRTRMI